MVIDCPKSNFIHWQHVISGNCDGFNQAKAPSVGMMMANIFFCIESRMEIIWISTELIVEGEVQNVVPYSVEVISNIVNCVWGLKMYSLTMEYCNMTHYMKIWKWSWLYWCKMLILTVILGHVLSYKKFL